MLMLSIFLQKTGNMSKLKDGTTERSNVEVQNELQYEY